MPGFVDEPTFFHGSLLAETPVLDPGLEHLAGIGFPTDMLEHLQAQAEERTLGFIEAWKRMAWLPARARLLDALWWRTDLDLTTQTLLMLTLCDGWLLREVESLTWRDLDARRGIAHVGDEPRRVLPHTLGVLIELQRHSKGDGPWGSMSRDEIVETLAKGWKALATAATPRGRRSASLPR